MSCPETCVIMGRVVSIVVAPPALIGANFPKYRAKKGAPTRAISSLTILEIKAMAPNWEATAAPATGAFNYIIRMDDNE